ncbi:uncharacterized protein N7479_005650 [Penicillium vulpinum]|uniref:DUF1446-domain-containing protein n=1 Tax=Penicillium vulpinum TaxID=29845 RepID=A0A1V6SE66_9EURO|nr:uncharacterized protein N7479_005650 [Penicillium vulpinum]KAJ5958500.1 hypothetical protein N7479_005650 [Penicillium vulpinum]OQE12080.1 hypothetical protein PENVUL_c001G01805 [Penicillium vulpinum]
MILTKSDTLRIASASGSVTDRRHGLAELARDEDLHFIVGDWMSEYNMTTRGGAKVKTNQQSSEFETSFMESIEPALDSISTRKIKVAVNAGASDTKKLHDILVKAIHNKGLDLKVAWIEGDEVCELLQDAIKAGEQFTNLTTGQKLSDWEFDPIYAQCYLGAWGIVEAFNQGADIVLCGRVTDASPTIACAAYHYQWSRQDFDELAHAFVAGHFLECSTYVTGGNFSGFKSLPGSVVDIGFPIIEINARGDFIVTIQKGKDGMVTENTCKAQLLYEIQGPLYYNPDVVAILDDIVIKEEGVNRVHVSNLKSIKPPPTTKIGITALGGFQAEVHYFLCGLDIEEKAALLEKQIRHLLDESLYHTLIFRTTGSCASDPSSQDAATVEVRIFAQSRPESALAPERFFRPCTDTIMQSYPGATFAVDTRQGAPKPYYEYFVSIFPQDRMRHICHVPFNNKQIGIPPPSDTVPFSLEQSSYETNAPFDLGVFGPTTRAPLGYVVHARSGDKGSDANVGFFVRHADEWDWLRTVLKVDKIRTLLGKDDVGNKIFRFELPNIWAVHFLLKDHLDRGVASSSTYDVLGKNVAEYLRCKYVDIPDKFLARGRI